jgi:hypothetical protein
LHDVERVYAMALTSLPRVVVVDAAAIWDRQRDEALGRSILAKLGLLAQQHAMRVVVRGVEPWQAEQLEQALPRDLLTMESRADGRDVSSVLPQEDTAAVTSVALLAHADTTVPDRCTAFFIGEGNAPRGAHPTRKKGAAATESILALYGTALTQERAGIAFRSISAGEPIPEKATASSGTLSGVVRAVERPPTPKPVAHAPFPNAQALCPSAACPKRFAVEVRSGDGTRAARRLSLF